jgi:polysaccharide export outer membrane protein
VVGFVSLLSKRGRMTSLRSLVWPLSLMALLPASCTAVNSLHLPSLGETSRTAGPPPPTPVRTAPAPDGSDGAAPNDGTASADSAPRAAAEALEAFRRVGEDHHAGGYQLGPGDRIAVEVWGRADLSSLQTIGPDGTITLPVVGDLRIGGLDRVAALAAVRSSFASAYQDLVVTLRVDAYESLRLVVLGQVRTPGEHRFSAPPDLLRAIGAAGGVDEPPDALDAAQPHLTAAAAALPWKAAILRGREAVLWVDLHALLREGDLSLNVPLIAGDVVHVSAEATPMIYVLGQVASPGIYPLRPGATLVDALAMAGGTTEDSNDDQVRLLRPSKSQRADFDFDSYAVGSFEFDLPLAAGDVVYVPTSWAGEIGYFLRQFSPLAQMLLFTDAVRD